jgi:hypothetical protein
MALRLGAQAGITELEARTGLSRHTVIRGRELVLAGGFNTSGPRVKVPAALLTERDAGAQAKVLYGLLQATPGLKGVTGSFTYASLGAWTQLSRNTLERGLTELAHTGWVQLTRKNRRSPIVFTLTTPERTRSRTLVAAAEQRLKRAKYSGEALMQEYLTLLIDSDQYTDNARPGFLVSPLTGERLELDRFYAPGVAFEYNGAQHYHRTDRFSQTEADAQQLRNLLKAGICLYRGIHLVIIHAEDLSLHGMRKRIGQSMPLRRLDGPDALIDLLENASIKYFAAAGPAKAHAQQN